MRWLWLVVLAGCLAKVPADDRDSDRVFDDADNCPDIANSDQSDLDRDGTGDACELCSSSDTTDSDGDGIPNACDGCDNTQPDDNGNGVPDVCEDPHDEDGDTIPDFRDNCPVVPNPDQLDTEEGMQPDGVGDMCDGDPMRDRQLFDPFTQPNQLWELEGDGWQVAQDHASVPSTDVGAFRYAGSARGTFHVRTHASIQPQGQVGIVVLDGGSMGSQARVMCMLEIGDPSQVVLDIDGIPTTMPYAGPPDAEIRLIGQTSPILSGGTTFTCAVSGAKVMGTAPSASVVWVTGLGTQQSAGSSTGTGTGTATFDYFDVVTNGS